MNFTASQNSKPKVLVLTSTFPRWQGDHEPAFVYELSRRLTDEFDIHVLAPHTAGSVLSEEMDSLRKSRFRYAPDFMECSTDKNDYTFPRQNTGEL